tara:strand:+ start:39 stop:473 length:435 start_codon:yes stop_codon:yes gene_type:complete
MKVKINTTVKAGRMIRNRNELTSALNQFEGQEITLSIEKAKKVRSTQENRYYWGLVIPLIKAGLKDATSESYSAEQVADLMKTRFLMIDVYIGDSDVMTRIKSTTELSTIEMERYLQECRTFAQEYLGVTIPMPNEDLTIEFNS